jgi:PDZ domain-containing protein
VAVTGTIDINGNVGAIGGLASKTSAVRQMGADIFIVPEAQGEEDLAKAQLVAGDEVEIIAVATLEEAVAALAERGGNGLDLGRPGEGYQPA